MLSYTLDHKFIDIFQFMSQYRSHTCGALCAQNIDQTATLSGWVHRKRDHGGLLFIDLRDHYGITQCVFNPDSEAFKAAEYLRNESIITVIGKVVKRIAGAENTKISTGAIEVVVEKVDVLYHGIDLPLPINSDVPYAEEVRLKYRYLDLRREKLHSNIIMRSKIIQALRTKMIAKGFLELQTPILTASSPEGARDYLVPSRHHPGHFYALPQAPQQFKQLYMVAGFDRYFQIAPCFRDEDARADRSPGEFYQLDLEMSFVTQEDVFSTMEPVLTEVFVEFGNGAKVPSPFPRITYQEAMDQYGSDKPDLRNPLRLQDVTSTFKDSEFTVFASAIEKGAVVKGIPVPNIAGQSRKFFDDLNGWAQSEGMKGLGYVLFENGAPKGPIAKFLKDNELQKLCGENGGVFFVCDRYDKACKYAGLARTAIAKKLNLIEENVFKFCWVVDFPMYEKDEETGKIDFSHNPFSMPQGGLDALNNKDPLTIKAYQYDIVCNGIELSSGAIRNHIPEIMYRAFEIAGYSAETVDDKFKGMIGALKFGAPPHGGFAPGIDRMVMLLCQEESIREIIAYPFNQQAQDLMMNAPAPVDPKQLKELGLSIVKKAGA